MEFIRISDQKLKITLTASDMATYDFDPNAFCDGTPRNGLAFRHLLADVRRQIPFETADRHLSVRYFPSRKGGCELFVSSLPIEDRDGKRGDVPPVSALTVRTGRQPSAIFRRDGAFRFSDVNALLHACRRLEGVGYRGESAAWKDDDGQYYILLVTLSPSPFSPPPEFSCLSEYGNAEDPVRLRVWFREHGKLICPADAVSILGALA